MRVTALTLVEPSGNSTGDFLDAVTRNVGFFRVGPLTGVFSLLSALFHLLVILPWVRPYYERGIDNHVNHFRWVEYSLSASVMIFLIAMFFGIYEIPYLITICICNAGCMWCGDIMEVMNNPRLLRGRPINWSPFILGCLLEFAAFQAIYVSLFSDGADGPVFVYAILGTQTFGFATFAINMALQYGKVGPWKDYRFGELIYMVLSASFKVILAFLVFGGLNQPNTFA